LNNLSTPTPVIETSIYARQLPVKLQHKLAASVSTSDLDTVPTPPGKSWIFLSKIPAPGKSCKNHFGPGKSWKLKLKLLESPRKISLKVMHFSSGSNGKQAAIA